MIYRCHPTSYRVEIYFSSILIPRDSSHIRLEYFIHTRLLISVYVKYNMYTTHKLYIKSHQSNSNPIECIYTSVHRSLQNPPKKRNRRERGKANPSAVAHKRSKGPQELRWKGTSVGALSLCIRHRFSIAGLGPYTYTEREREKERDCFDVTHGPKPPGAQFAAGQLYRSEKRRCLWYMVCRRSSCVCELNACTRYVYICVYIDCERLIRCCLG